MAHLTPKIISNLKPETQATLVDNIMALGSEWFQSPLKLTTLISIYKVFIVSSLNSFYGFILFRFTVCYT